MNISLSQTFTQKEIEEFKTGFLSLDQANKLKMAITMIQPVVDQLRELPDYVEYVKKRKLSLLDHRFSLVDNLLKAGLVK